MTKPFETKLNFAKGYWPNQGLIGDERVPSSVIDGKNVWIEGPGRARSWGGPAQQTAAYGNSIMQVLGTKIATQTTGSSCLFRNGAILTVGSGSVRVGDLSSFTTIGTASANLQISLDGTASSLFQAGINVPVAPTPTQTTNTSFLGKSAPLAGTYSFKLTFIRDSDNAEGNGSPATPVFTSDGTHTVKLTFSGQPSTPGSFSYGIYISRRGFPEGPWFFLQKVSGINTQQEIAWYDGDLSSVESPITNDSPATDFPNGGTHVFALGKYAIFAGILGNGGLIPSAPGRPENFDPEQVTFLNPNEAILGIRGRPADGWQYVFCRNSLHSVYLTGNDDEPIQARAIWSEIGIANASAASFVGGEFYAYSAKKGALRTTAGNQTAEPDVSFSLPVENRLEKYDPTTVVVGYSQDEDSVIYFGNNSGQWEALPYRRKLDAWSTPMILSDAGVTGGVQSCVTYQGKLIFSSGGNLYDFSAGASSTIPWQVIPVWQDASEADGDGWYKTITGYRTAFNTGTNNFKNELLINFDQGNVKNTQNTTGANDNYTTWKKCNVKKAVSFTMRHSGTGGNQYVYDTVVKGGITKIRV